MELPNWLWLIIIVTSVIIIGYIYYKLPQGIKYNINKILTGKLLLALIIAGSWWYWHSKDIIVEGNQSNWWMPMIILFFIIVITGLGYLKYISKQVITPNFHGCYTRTILKNGFVVLDIGSLNIVGNPTPADKILILRQETFREFEESSFSLCRVAPVGLHDVDPDIKEIIDKSFFHFRKAKQRQEIYYGWFDDVNRIDWDNDELERVSNLEPHEILKEFYTLWCEEHETYLWMKKNLNVTNPSVTALLRYARNRDKEYNKQSDVLRSVIDDTEEGIEHFRRRRRAYVDKDENPPSSEGYEHQ